MRASRIERIAPAVNEQWERIECWLAANAPPVHAALAPGATIRQIAEIERLARTELPADFCASYRRHSGTLQEGARGLFGGSTFLSAEQIGDWYRRWRSTAGRGDSPLRFTTSDHHWVRPESGNPLWIPFGAKSECEVWYLDLDPMPEGNRGQVVLVDHSLLCASREADSFLQWLQRFADELDAGMYIASNREAGTIVHCLDTDARYR